VLDCWLDFCAAVHHERTLPENGFVNWLTAHHQKRSVRLWMRSSFFIASFFSRQHFNAARSAPEIPYCFGEHTCGIDSEFVAGPNRAVVHVFASILADELTGEEMRVARRDADVSCRLPADDE